MTLWEMLQQMQQMLSTDTLSSPLGSAGSGIPSPGAPTTLGGGGDTFISTQPATAPASTPDANYAQGAGIQYSPGGMPQGGYNQETAAGDWWSPGGMPAGGTGFPVQGDYPTATDNWVSPYGADYGTAAYTPPPGFDNPITRVYGQSSWQRGQGPLQLSPEDMQQFLRQGGYHGDPNDPEALMAYTSQFPTAVQDLMKPGGPLWARIHDPSWNPSTGWKGVLIDPTDPYHGGSTRGKPPTPEQIQRMYAFLSNPNTGFTAPMKAMIAEHFNKEHLGNYLTGIPGMKRYWAPGEQAAFNKDRQLQGHQAYAAALAADPNGTAAIRAAAGPRASPASAAMFQQMQQMQNPPPGPPTMEDVWNRAQRSSYNDITLGGNQFGGVIEHPFANLGFMHGVTPPPGTFPGMDQPNPFKIANQGYDPNTQYGPPEDPWGVLNQMGIRDPRQPQTSFGTSPWGSGSWQGSSWAWPQSNPNSFGDSPWGQNSPWTR
jgi:hypothetical protein